jgi:ABC-type hemin transport system ATPase subunit
VQPRASGEVLLKARGLAKSFRGVKALAGVDVEVRRGEILGLLGPNGSGKSTFINVVSGHYLPTGGSVVFEGAGTGRPRGAPHRACRHRAHLPDPAPVRPPDACSTTWRSPPCSAAASPRPRRRGARR